MTTIRFAQTDSVDAIYTKIKEVVHSYGVACNVAFTGMMPGILVEIKPISIK